MVTATTVTKIRPRYLMLRTPILRQATKHSHSTRFIMGKKKNNLAYNDFTEDTRYVKNNDTNIQTTLHSASPLSRTISHPSPQHPNSTPNPRNPRTKPLTHFLALPLVTPTNRPHLASALADLKKDVQQLTRVPPAAVRPVGALHLTLGVMALSGAQLSNVVAVLEGLDLAALLRAATTTAALDQHTPTPTLTLTLRGLLPMHLPRATSVLYAEPVDATGRLVRFGEGVRSAFEERGCVCRDARALRVHATVLNTVYARPKRGKKAAGSSGEGAGGGLMQGVDGGVEEAQARGRDDRGADAQSWGKFDASGLIEKYRDFVWAEDVRIDRVQICKMGAQKIVDEETGEVVDERYEIVAEKTM
ncbi:uncharacterized protein M421DRAFT_424531 [Didymella exigua CBS 183.55]|uniref:A-kinase anchor protein 7-like phosphoesterase domain-containing protein n=1 Tax=Didymella exigua CBS 183.55 TaxID=1150837 RepID=A0A6A5RG95_9PLEO|nr:uncharacterized protein M421DRAFT_424531 [Didymella exigua CBS 183.55]KAF1924647.1 hypothetical protein M421DRAFT_424531 [Didymella exigua CBS 183.55]